VNVGYVGRSENGRTDARCVWCINNAFGDVRVGTDVVPRPSDSERRKGNGEGWMEIQHFVKNSKTRGYKSYIVCIFGEHVRHIQGKENMKLE